MKKVRNGNKKNRGRKIERLEIKKEKNQKEKKGKQ